MKDHKVLRLATLIVGLVALGFFVGNVYYELAHVRFLGWNWERAWYVITVPPRSVIGLIRLLLTQPQVLIKGSWLANVRMVAYLTGIVLCPLLAHRLNQATLDWLLWGVFAPFLAPLLAFRKRRPTRSLGVILGFVAFLKTPASSSGYGSYSISKNCSACGRPVSSAARAGQRCPHCGAYWSYERQR